MARSILRPLVSLVLLGALPVPFAAAQISSAPATDAPASDQSAGSDATAKPDQTYAIHAQSTLVVQGVKGFASPYTGDNSLHPHDTEETVDATLYLGVRPWKGAELWVNPEIDQGFGLSNTLGAGGFPSAEAYKVGKNNPYFKLQRLFLRQTIALGGKDVTLDAAANQLRTTITANRIVITAGKIGVGDVFDTNAYAHDPRGDFLNWSLVDTGSFDYAANAWGYTYGAAVEWYQGDWTLRGGLFTLSKIPNGEELGTNLHQNEIVGEIEHRHTLLGQPGAIRVTGFRNRGMFARYDDAVALARSTGGAVDLAPVRRMQNRAGIALNAEQSLTANLGVFLRAGTTNGAIETYDFTDIDRTIAFGGSLKGKAWGRAQDSFALAFVNNAISQSFQHYLAAGGIGVLVGDGALPHPGDERILEAYYTYRPVSWASATVDFQHIANPGYNRDRGPANVLGARLHVGF
jgi:high affinity Mn2+ porin